MAKIRPAHPLLCIGLAIVYFNGCEAIKCYLRMGVPSNECLVRIPTDCSKIANKTNSMVMHLKDNENFTLDEGTKALMESTVWDRCVVQSSVFTLQGNGSEEMTIGGCASGGTTTCEILKSALAPKWTVTCAEDKKTCLTDLCNGSSRIESFLVPFYVFTAVWYSLRMNAQIY